MLPRPRGRRQRTASGRCRGALFFHLVTGALASPAPFTEREAACAGRFSDLKRTVCQAPSPTESALGPCAGRGRSSPPCRCLEIAVAKKNVQRVGILVDVTLVMRRPIGRWSRRRLLARIEEGVIRVTLSMSPGLVGAWGTTEVIRAALSVGVGQGREMIARAVRRAGYGVGASTVRRVLMRRGLWPGSEVGVRDRGHRRETRPTRHAPTHCAGRVLVRRGDGR